MNKVTQLRVAENIKYLRKSFGYTQSKVAEALHISRSTYCLIEQGKRVANLDFLMDLSLIYGIETSVIIELDKKKFLWGLSLLSEKGSRIGRLFEIYPKLTPFEQGRLIEKAEELLLKKE